MKSEFNNNDTLVLINHLKSQVTIITGYGELLQANSQMDELGRQGVEQIIAAARRMDDRLNQALE